MRCFVHGDFEPETGFLCPICGGVMFEPEPQCPSCGASLVRVSSGMYMHKEKGCHWLYLAPRSVVWGVPR